MGDWPTPKWIYFDPLPTPPKTLVRRVLLFSHGARSRWKVCFEDRQEDVPAMRLVIHVLGVLWCCDACSAAGVASHSKRLLIDPRVVDTVSSAEIAMGAVQKHSAPLLMEDRPWEFTFLNMFPSIWYDTQVSKYRLWYWAAEALADTKKAMDAAYIKRRLFYALARCASFPRTPTVILRATAAKRPFLACGDPNPRFGPPHHLMRRPWATQSEMTIGVCIGVCTCIVGSYSRKDMGPFLTSVGVVT